MRPADVDLATGDIPTGEVVELLCQLIRNRCVNDGRPDSGEEDRNAATLADYLAGAGLDVERYEPRPGRTSLVARLEGSDPAAPSVCLMGHTDVVPVTPEGWDEDPVLGEVRDGEVWGRGAVDMLNLTSAMAAVTRRLAAHGRRPRGDLIFFGVADVEAAGVWGAGWMAEHHCNAITCDYVLTENGGLLSNGPQGRHVLMHVAEKGFAWRRLVVRGTPGHGSMPYGADNALVTAAQVIERLARYRPRPEVTELWRRRVETLDLSPALREALLDPARLDDAIADLPGRGAAANFHACTHTTFSPNLARAGVKTNVIPDRVDLDVDIRTLPGETPDTVLEHLRAALGDELFARVEVASLGDSPATSSPLATPMWDAMAAAVQAQHAGTSLVPGMIVGLTDARFFRARGVVAYGAGLMSPGLSAADFSARFHGNNERVDLESLRLTTEFYGSVLDRLWA
jgi:acetylornithine deacetylase/succinyl-diaminopimelate desuccinylase-like protein